MSGQMECRACDGTGWVEGGTAIRTPCSRCGGLGALSDLVHRPPVSIPSSPEVEAAELRFRAITSPSVDLALALSLKELRAAQHAATLASLTPTEAVLEQAMEGLGDMAAPTCYPRCDCRRCFDLRRKAVENLAPILHADKEREIERLRYIEQLYGHTIDRTTTAEAEAQKLREAVANFVAVCDDLDGKTGGRSEHGLYCIERRRVDGLRKALGGSK